MLRQVDFVLAGFESGGSTSLAQWLNSQEDIYMAPFELSALGLRRQS